MLGSLGTPLLAVLAAAGQPQATVPAQEPLALTFGVYQTDKATEMYRQFTPVLEALQVDLGQRLQRDVDIALCIFRSYDEGLQALVDGEVDFVRFGPASYIMAKEKNKHVQLLAMEEVKGQTIFYGLIVARAGDDIHTLEDLRHRRFAFGDPNSTIGRFLAQAELVAAGITSRDLEDMDYLGRHDKVLRAVEHGDFDAGSLKESTYEKLNTEGHLKVVHRFQNITKPWIAREGLDADLAEAISRSLIECKDEAVLANFGVTAFVPTTDEAYDFVRKGMERAKKFERKAKATPRPKGR